MRCDVAGKHVLHSPAGSRISWAAQPAPLCAAAPPRGGGRAWRRAELRRLADGRHSAFCRWPAGAGCAG